MNESDRKSLLISLASAVLALLSVFSFFSYLYVSGELSHLEVEDARVIPLGVPVNQLSEIWFSSQGKLLGTFQNSAVLFFATWDGDGRAQPMRTINFDAITGVSLGSLANSFRGGDMGQGVRRPVLPYAVSDDGSMLAWSLRDQIFIASMKDVGAAKSISVGDAAPITALAFTDNNLVTVVHENGELWTWDLIKSQRISGFPLKGAKPSADWLIWSRGPVRVLSSFPTSNAVTLRVTRERLDHQGFPSTPDGRCVTSSLTGKVLLGTQGGIVVTVEPSRPSPCVVIEGMKSIQALAYYDEDLAIAGGDGQGLYLIRSGKVATRLAMTPQGIRLLAVSKDLVAYATKQALVIAKLKWRLGLSERAKWLMAVMFSLISLIAFVRVSLIDLLKLAAG